jgi:DNA-nicking Smr family endonuclease
MCRTESSSGDFPIERGPAIPDNDVHEMVIQYVYQDTYCLNLRESGPKEARLVLAQGLEDCRRKGIRKLQVTLGPPETRDRKVKKAVDAVLDRHPLVCARLLRHAGVLVELSAG